MIAALRGERQANQAAPVRGLEIDDFRSDFFGRDRLIAFVFAVLIVNHHHNAADSNFLDGFWYRNERHIVTSNIAVFSA